MRHQKLLLIAASTAAMTFSQWTMAAGFSLSAQGAYGMGNAYAGNAAVASDASTVLTNPAGIFELDKPVFGFTTAFTGTKGAFRDRGSLTNAGLGPVYSAQPIALAGGRSTGLDQRSVTPTPELYYARQFNDKWAFGMGFNIPFATSSNYGENWIGRYHAVETAVTAFNINPNIAYRINDKVSIAGGLSVQIANALLTSKLDSGVTCFGIANSAPSITVPDCLGAGLQPNDPSIDSDVRLEGSGTQVTFNLGLLFKPKEGTKIGVTYRHGAKHSLEGDATFTNTAVLNELINENIPAGFRPAQNTDITISADLPAIFDLSVAQKASDKIELLGTFKWTQWSSFDKLISDFDNPAQDNSELNFEWKDSITISAGMNYTLNTKTTLRTGVAFDQSPIPDPSVRSPRGPADDRYWISFGATHAFSKKISVNAGFSKILISEAAIANPGNPGNPTLRGAYNFNVNLAAVQLNWHFD